MPTTCTITVTIVNRLGLHARPAMSFVDVASTFPCSVKVKKGDTVVDGKSIMQMMMLAAGKGTALEVITEGDKCEEASKALMALVAGGFDEE